nr:NAD(P)-binding protein [Paracoccus sphaerophysae]
MPDRTGWDPVVVGAGISGALTVEALSRAGRRVLVPDRRAAVRGSTPASTAMIQHEIDVPLSRLIRQTGRARAGRGRVAALGAGGGGSGGPGPAAADRMRHAAQAGSVSRRRRHGRARPADRGRGPPRRRHRLRPSAARRTARPLRYRPDGGAGVGRLGQRQPGAAGGGGCWARLPHAAWLDDFLVWKAADPYLYFRSTRRTG